MVVLYQIVGVVVMCVVVGGYYVVEVYFLDVIEQVLVVVQIV